MIELGWDQVLAFRLARHGLVRGRIAGTWDLTDGVVTRDRVPLRQR